MPRKKKKAKPPRPKKHAQSPEEVPCGVSPLALAVGQKIDYVRQGVKMTHNNLARTLGVPAHILMAIIRGYELPGPQLAERIKLWMFEGHDFSGSPLRIVRQQRKPVDKTYLEIRTYVPEDLKKAIFRTSIQLGVSPTIFIHLACLYLLENQPTILSLGHAARQLEEVLAKQALIEIPALVDIVEGDKTYAVRQLDGKIGRYGRGPRRKKITTRTYDFMSIPLEMESLVPGTEGTLAVPIYDPDLDRKFREV